MLYFVGGGGGGRRGVERAYGVVRGRRHDTLLPHLSPKNCHSRALSQPQTTRFWPRLVATSLCWVANDFAFYGNKLFSSVFISALYPGATDFVKVQWTVVNSAVALCGYYTAAMMVDRPWYGRRIMQGVGFVMMFILFGICAVAYPTLTASAAGYRGFQVCVFFIFVYFLCVFVAAGVFVCVCGWSLLTHNPYPHTTHNTTNKPKQTKFLYFFSSYWNQFGPNCTTWLVAAEVYPTDVRATCQGFSAAMGKLGAILADIIFGYVDTRTTFYLSAAFGLFGAILTAIFLPDTTGLSLDELDRMAKYMVAGEFDSYHGQAVNPKHLSLYERFVMRWDRHFDPAADAEQLNVQLETDKDANHVAVSEIALTGLGNTDTLRPSSVTARNGHGHAHGHHVAFNDREIA